MKSHPEGFANPKDHRLSDGVAALISLLPPEPGSTVPLCPVCTKRAADHPGLTFDVLVKPTFTIGRHGRKWDALHPSEALTNPRTSWFVSIACPHSRRLDAGDYRTEAEITDAWAGIVVALCDGGPQSIESK